jgi:prepilin-type N-terminal cleavage/methylation domain-containing protein
MGAGYGICFAFTLAVKTEERKMKTKKCLRYKGFTLIELTVVVIIIGVLAAIAIPRFMRSSTRTKQGEAQLILKQIYTMQRVYRQQNDAYFPGDGSTVVVQPGSFVAPLDVEITPSARYSYSISGDAHGFSAIAGSKAPTGLDDDPALDVWSIDQTGIVTCISDDSQN